MRHSTNADFLATSRAPESSLLLGKHLWVVHNDSVECSIEGETSYRTHLTLHACRPEQFACGNAFCVEMAKRCDAVVDCSDGSDEQDCRKLIRTNEYNKELTPILRTGQDVIVNFSLNIIDIEVDESTKTFTTRISFTRSWCDGRLMYKNLKRQSGTGLHMNALSAEEANAIWYAYVVFYNVRDSEDTKQTEVLDSLEVVPNEDFKYETRNNMHIFKGSENALRYTREYSVSWKCEYAYHWYPFDTQFCRMEFASLRDQTEFNLTKLQHNPNISLNRYTLRRIKMCNSVVNQMKAIVVDITLGRPIVSNLFTVFIPTMLLVVISFTTRFFAEDYIDMVIPVNATILQVLATM